MGHFVPPPVSNRSLLPSARSSLQSSRLRRLRNEGDGRVNEVSETVTEGRRQSDRGGKGRFGLSLLALHPAALSVGSLPLRSSGSLRYTPNRGAASLRGDGKCEE